MTKTQKYIKSKDCKHSVVFVPQPGETTPENPEICSSVYISRLALPRGGAGVNAVTLTIEVEE